VESRLAAAQGDELFETVEHLVPDRCFVGKRCFQFAIVEL
jgi:hypothetical protein